MKTVQYGFFQTENTQSVQNHMEHLQNVIAYYMILLQIPQKWNLKTFTKDKKPISV